MLDYAKYIKKLIRTVSFYLFNVATRIFKIEYVVHIILLWDNIGCASGLFLPQCVFSQVTSGGLGTSSGQQAQLSGKRPRYGSEEKEDKTETL